MLEDLKRPELIKLMKEKGLEFDLKMKNVDMIEAIQTVDPIGGDLPGGDGKPMEEKTLEEIETIAKAIVDKPTTHDVIEDLTVKIDGEVQTKSGIVVPPEVMIRLGKRQFSYRYDCNSEGCSVYKKPINGSEMFVRIYTEDLHGKDYKKMAEGFVLKNNNK
jgi:hypothetical protein